MVEVEKIEEHEKRNIKPWKNTISKIDRIRWNNWKDI